MKQFDLAELAAAVPAESAWLRVLIERTGATWTLRYADAAVGSRPAAWTDQAWLYETLRFLCLRVPTAELIGALSAENDGHLPIGECDVVIPCVQKTGQAEHHPSFERHDRARSSRPSFDYQLSREAGDNIGLGSQMGFLVGSDSPSFTSVEAAYRGFFLGSYDETAQDSIPHHLMSIRVSDDRAWLGPIHIKATEMTVCVGGTAPRGTTLEYFSPSHRERFSVDAAGERTIALPNGLPTRNTWLWLTQSHTWRDYRALSPSWASAEQLAAAGVEIEPDRRDEQAAVEAIIYGGEGPLVEFKHALPEAGAKKTDSGCKTIAAFANGAGGTLVYGIDRDEVTVTGLGESPDPNKERDRIGQLIRNRVVPTPEFDIQVQEVSGKPLMFVTVAPGTNPPYGLITGTDQRDKPQYYVRRGASTYPAQPSDFHGFLRRAAHPPEFRR